MGGTQALTLSIGPADKATDWPAAFFADADKLHLPTLMNWFGDNIDLRLANTPPIIGRADVEATFKQFWSTISGMSHAREQVVVDGDCAFQGSIVTYTRLNGKKAAMPVASHLRLDGKGRLNRLWIYIDLAPLFAEE